MSRVRYATMGGRSREHIRQNYYTPMKKGGRTECMSSGGKNDDALSLSASAPTSPSLKRSEPFGPSTSRPISPPVSNLLYGTMNVSVKRAPMSSQKMPDPRKGPRATPFKSSKPKAQPPVRPIAHDSPAVLKPEALLRDVIPHGKGLPKEDFFLPTTLYTIDALAESAHVRGVDHDAFARFINGGRRASDKMSRMAEAKLHLLTHGMSADMSNPNESKQLPDAVWEDVVEGRKDFITAVKEARNETEETEKKINEEFSFARPSTPAKKRSPTINIAPLAIPRVLETPAKGSRPRGRPPTAQKDTPRPPRSLTPAPKARISKRASTSKVSSRPSSPSPLSTGVPLQIISHNADASLRPPPIFDPEKESAKIKALDTVVSKLIHLKSKEINESPPSVSISTPPPSVDSFGEETSTISAKAGNKKRKSSDPCKVIAEAELLPIATRKGGKRKKNGGIMETPVKKFKLPSIPTRLLLDNSFGHRSENAPLEDDGLPPRIVVKGQEPGTELESDEEEIIVLRAGEQPEQRPPILKRKKEEKKAERDEANPVEGETVTMDDAVREEAEVEFPHPFGTPAPITFDTSFSSENLSITSTFDQSYVSVGGGTSPITATVTHVLSTMSDEIADLSYIPIVPIVKRESMESVSSVDSNEGRRSKRAVKATARFSPSPHKVSPTAASRNQSQIGVEPNGLNVNNHIPPFDDVITMQYPTC